MLRASLFTLFTARHKVPYYAFLAGILYIHLWVRTVHTHSLVPEKNIQFLSCFAAAAAGGSGLDIVTERVGWWSFPYGEMQKHKVEG